MLFVDNTFLLKILFADITFWAEEDPENRVAEKLLTGGNFKQEEGEMDRRGSIEEL